MLIRTSESTWLYAKKQAPSCLEQPGAVIHHERGFTVDDRIVVGIGTGSQPEWRTMTLAEAIGRFLAALSAGITPESFRTYRRALMGLLAVVGDVRLVGVTTASLQHWCQHQEGQGVKLAAISRRVRVVRRFFNWLADEGHLSTNPVAALAWPLAPAGSSDAGPIFSGPVLGGGQVPDAGRRRREYVLSLVGVASPRTHQTYSGTIALFAGLLWC